MRFSDYVELDSYIDSLPPPEPRHIRVFRGQYKDHENLKPTGVRTPLRNEGVWRQYCKLLATEMLMRQGLSADEALSQSDLWAYWYYAIVQHYGPGTHLLDVTHSLDVALWFALHRAITNKRINLQFQYTNPKSPGPTLDRKDDWTSYEKWREAPGVLYIFDVPVWAPPGLPAHGTLVDLARAPDVFTTSARIQVQRACLIAADVNDCSGGDLKGCLAHSPIEVEWPMIPCAVAELPESALFPSPKEDEWYARLLFLPVVHQLSHEEPHWRMGHPVPLTLYIEHLEASIYAIQFKPLQPPLLHPWLVLPALKMNLTDAAAHERSARFVSTVPILLEAPIFALHPEADDKSWNQEMLVRGLPENLVGVVDLVSGELAGYGEDFRDVLFELSPLEIVGWTYLLKKGAEMIVQRAVHLVREHELAWRMEVYLQRAPKEQIATHVFAIRFDRSSRRFHIKQSNKWKDISVHKLAAKTLFVALAILGDLSTDSKSRARAVLKEAPEVVPGWRYFVLRDPETNEVYTRIVPDG
jgi:hypothetical protein